MNRMEHLDLVKSIYEKLQDEGLLKMELPFAALSTTELRPFVAIDEMISQEFADQVALYGAA